MGFRWRLLSFVEIWLNCSIYIYLLYRLGKKFDSDESNSFFLNNSQKLDSSRVFRLELLKGIRSFSPTRRTFAKKKEKKKAKDGRGKRGKSRRRIAGVKEESGRCFDRGTLQLSILGSTRKCIGRRETCG